jgi:hypothetical protein
MRRERNRQQTLQPLLLTIDEGTHLISVNHSIGRGRMCEVLRNSTAETCTILQGIDMVPVLKRPQYLF